MSNYNITYSAKPRAQCWSRNSIELTFALEFTTKYCWGHWFLTALGEVFINIGFSATRDEFQQLKMCASSLSQWAISLTKILMMVSERRASTKMPSRTPNFKPFFLGLL